MRAAIYRRVSTTRQANKDRFSLKEQLEKCTAWCAEHGHEIVADLNEVQMVLTWMNTQN